MSAVNAEPSASPEEGAKYLSFLVDSEEYAVDILRVREIRGMCAITPLPNSPPQIRGVMNLRGAVVPVVDLRIALGLEKAAYSKFTVIVVLSVHGRTIGFVADSVCDVLSLTTTDIEATPDVGARVDASLVAGIGRVANRFVVLLDAQAIAPKFNGATS